MDNEILKRMKEKNDFINSFEGKNRDNLMKLQNKIDEALNKAGNNNNRLVIIKNMMIESLLELSKKYQKFYESILDIKSSITDIKNIQGDE